MAQTLEAVFFRGDQSRTDYNAGAVANGVIVDLGEIAGVCTSPEGIAASGVGSYGSLAISGVFRIKSASATVFAKGVDVFWDTVTRLAVTAAGANIIRLGVADMAKANGEDGVCTILNQPKVQS
jgi:predicted RecA/RadA family phage recombinase